MCGFAGVIDFEKVHTKRYREYIEAASRQIVHRGPDDSGMFEDEHAILAFRRLSIIDVDGGHQPMPYGDDDRYQIVFNGEIYNYVELRELLFRKGERLKTETDTEVIVALYHLYGKDVLRYLRGMFSFLIWDTQEQHLFAARDHFGIKPLYYIEDGFTVLFASEMKCLKEYKRTAYVNDVSLQHYLSFQYVPDPDTIQKEIHKVPPGYCVTKVAGDRMVLEKYWEPKMKPVPSNDESRMIDAIQTVIVDSVKMHMRSDVPVGSFLSGGVDSSIIASIARQFHPGLKTFSVGFKQEGYSEIDVAKETAAAIGAENFAYYVDHTEFMRELPKIIWHMDDPVADPASIPLYFLSREARKHVKVVLSGEGADELFAGYNIYKEPYDLSVFGHLPTGIRQALKQLASIFPEGMKGKSFIERGTTLLEDRYIGNANIFSADEKKRLLTGRDQYVNPTEITGDLFENVRHLDSVSKMQYIDLMTWLKGDILVKADKMTMAHSLELRVPFLDREVFHAAAAIPYEWKVKNGETKYLLRQAVRDLVPSHVLNRRKLGFPVPIRNWLKHEMYEWASALISESELDGLINKGFAHELLEKHRKGEADYSRKIWTILTFILWHQVFIENVYSFNRDKLAAAT
ncbi:asparagine synthase (glutamine-hydrolyzing) [Metabacillus idriensis]|uniref:asparagine synthase (glutamine-hydrolyzing) n=1 Tax=Metabacillus idriensis TaxID=324768 RepID=A0A6I2ME00_9BACI|nr:asparagine synthase (glutamine-hydrolyzing) [Metabacillus idriensis]MCM3596650.1 asparagine synthase (glutamine-hydrolyzing) [Metabacillus idriensis]MRX55266.1 asparagine synthase (glutamine-hydrolyzing) [Metabacillus idriensis]OHR67961.1 asparagine synthetase B [Bacillus sp. HMSC76G11]